MDRASTLIASYQPESDLTALIERYRTGPFRPTAHVYESVSHEGTDVVFGIDLLKWAGESGWAALRVPEDEKKKDAIPPVLSSLLQALDVSYGKLASDDGILSLSSKRSLFADYQFKNEDDPGFMRFPSLRFTTFARLLTVYRATSPFP